MEDGILVQRPMDFQRKNRLSIRSLEALLKRVLFPEIYEEQERFGSAARRLYFFTLLDEP